MACLENPGTEGAAQIGDLPVSKSGKIRDGKFHSLLIINTYISGGRIPLLYSCRKEQPVCG